MLERGQRHFDRRGLIENLAVALGCSVLDLTGQPYQSTDPASAEALGTLPEISVALHDTTLDDAPDIPVRPVAELAPLAAAANEHSAHCRYGPAARDLGAVLTELHVHVATGDNDARRTALFALVEASLVACGAARTLGWPDLAVAASDRARAAAALLDDPAPGAFAAMSQVGALCRLGARRRAGSVAVDGLAAVAAADPSAENTASAEAYGMLHLAAAQIAAKDQRPQDADSHLTEAAEIAARTGERNHLWCSFGPANVRAWSMSIAVELERGPSEAERVESAPDYLAGLSAADRRSAMHFDLSRAYAQAGGDRDTAALQHLDAADQLASQKIRYDPVARELLAALDTRARMQTWQLDSLKNRFASAATG